MRSMTPAPPMGLARKTHPRGQNFTGELVDDIGAREAAVVAGPEVPRSRLRRSEEYRPFVPQSDTH
jgi:hypothetical protein